MQHIACGILRAPADPLVRPGRASSAPQPATTEAGKSLTCLSAAAAAAVSPVLSPSARFLLHSPSNPLHLYSHPLGSATVLPCDTGRAGDPPIMNLPFDSSVTSRKCREVRVCRLMSALAGLGIDAYNSNQPLIVQITLK